MPKIIAHRGGCYAHENSIPNIERTLIYGNYGIEVDLRYTLDGKLVIFHDECIAGKRVRELSFKEVKFLDKDVITLTDLMRWLRSKGLSPLLKLDKKEGVDDYLIFEEIEDYEGEVIINLEKDFKPHPLPYVESNNLRLEYGHSSLSPMENLNRAISYGVEIVSLTWPFINKDIVDRAHNNGLKVDVYYPRELEIDKGRLIEIMRLGVDYLTIKDPRLVTEILKGI